MTISRKIKIIYSTDDYETHLTFEEAIMKVLVDVWKRTSKRTNKIEYVGAYKTYHSCGSDSEIALITKASYDNFRKTKKSKKTSRKTA